MKKKFSFLPALLAAMTLLVGCNKEDSGMQIEKNLAGAYKGGLSIAIGALPPSAAIPQKVYISKSESSSEQVKLELRDFAFGAANLGNIVVDACAVTQKGSDYTFTGSQTIQLEAGIGSCPVTVEGTIKSDGSIAITIDVTVESLKMEVTATFNGMKLKGTESPDANITTFTIAHAAMVEQPTIDQTARTISFTVSKEATEADLAALTPTIEVSPNAVVTPASGTAQDFSAGKVVTYTVVAEDGTIRTYQASVAGKRTSLKYSFEEWETYAEEAELPLPRAELASSSEGAALLSGYGKGVPLYKSDDKVAGTYAAKLVTLDLSEHANALVPAITAGSVYTGSFDMMAAFEDRLKCTIFGIPYATKPLRFKGWYKYAPGTKFVDGSNLENIVEVPNKKDECAISAVLFKIEKDDDALDGRTINDSPSRVAVAALTDGTAKAEYTAFDIPFTYLPGKSYEAGAKYKIAIVCSSSKEGDLFKGAGGSTLMIDELEVIGE